jgi:hypothetical protein
VQKIIRYHENQIRYDVQDIQIMISKMYKMYREGLGIIDELTLMSSGTKKLNPEEADIDFLYLAQYKRSCHQVPLR